MQTSSLREEDTSRTSLKVEATKELFLCHRMSLLYRMSNSGFSQRNARVNEFEYNFVYFILPATRCYKMLLLILRYHEFNDSYALMCNLGRFIKL